MAAGSALKRAAILQVLRVTAPCSSRRALRWWACCLWFAWCGVCVLQGGLRALLSPRQRLNLHGAHSAPGPSAERCDAADTPEVCMFVQRMCGYVHTMNMTAHTGPVSCVCRSCLSQRHCGLGVGQWSLHKCVVWRVCVCVPGRWQVSRH